MKELASTAPSVGAGPLPDLSRASAVIGVVIASLGALVLIGWALNITLLKSVLPHLVTMKANTAAAFLLSGTALWLLSGRQDFKGLHALARACALVTAAVGLLTLYEYGADTNLSIDQLLFTETAAAVGTSNPGRMAPPTALCFALVGIALVLMDRRAVTSTSQFLALGSGLIGLLALCGYILEVKPLYGLARYTQMAVHTSMAFVVLAAGICLRQTAGGWMATVTGPGLGSRQLRVLLPVIIIVPLVMAWLRLHGQYAGWYGVELGLVMMTFGSIVILVSVTYASARHLNRTDQMRLEAEHQLEAANRSLEIRVAQRTVQIQAANQSLLDEVHRRRSAEDQLRRQRDEAESYFEVISVMMVVLAPDQTVVRINARGCKLLGCAREEILGRNWFDAFVPERDRQRTREVFSRLMAGELVPAEHFENSVLTHTGRERLISWHNAYLRDDAGRIMATLSSGVDITDQRAVDDEVRRLNTELEERVAARTAQLAASNKELEAFSYSVSHDLRAPLRHISGFVDLLQRHGGDQLTPQSRGYLDMVADAARQMGQLIDDLLSFSRMGRAAMSIAPFDLGPLVEEVIRAAAPSAQGRDIEWVIGALPEVRGDYAMLRQVLTNLVENAIKYSRPRAHARIEIGASTPTPDETVVFVRDNGVGFDMRYADKLFGVFQRLHRADEFEGSGIGLANVRRIVHRHGGRTWAEGETDRGATFYFSLPANITEDGGGI
jgi:PAS domain S-box-containing protein